MTDQTATDGATTGKRRIVVQLLPKDAERFDRLVGTIGDGNITRTVEAMIRITDKLIELTGGKEITVKTQDGELITFILV